MFARRWCCAIASLHVDLWFVDRFRGLVGALRRGRGWTLFWRTRIFEGGRQAEGCRLGF